MPTQPITRNRVAAAIVVVGATVGTLGLATAAASPTGSTALAPNPTATAARPDPTATAVRPDPTATAVAPDRMAPTRAATPPAVPGTTFVRTELYFGTDRAIDPDVSDGQFARFVARVVTPRFPDGLTQHEAQGQFRSSDGTLVREKSFVIVLFYPRDDVEANTEIEEIRKLYKDVFDQESVLRADSTDRVSF